MTGALAWQTYFELIRIWSLTRIYLDPTYSTEAKQHVSTFIVYNDTKKYVRVPSICTILIDYENRVSVYNIRCSEDNESKAALAKESA
ncbi:hypothetical protein YC2023_042619 [Brassica napus]